MVVLPLVALIAVTCADLQLVNAQGKGWKPSEVLVTKRAFMTEVTMTADRAGNLHLFWVGLCGDEGQTLSREQVPMEERTDVCYLKWDGSSGWSFVANILRLPGRTTWLRAVVDQTGNIHLIWRGDGCLDYSWNAVALASAAGPWIDHRRCLASAISTSPAIAYDPGRDKLYVMFTESEGNVLIMRSDNGGVSWTRPFVVAEPHAAFGSSEGAVYTGYPALTVDESGTIHAVWNSFPQSGYPSLGVFYAQSSDGGVSWSVPQELAGEHHTQPNVAAYGATDLVVVWNGDAGTAGRYARRSSDGGTEWGEMEVLLPRSVPGGTLGPPGLVYDGEGTIHVLMGSNDWIYYTHSVGRRWSSPERLSVPMGYQDGLPLVKFEEDPNETHTPRLEITHGNLLHAIWSGVDTLEYTVRELATPYEPPKEWLTRVTAAPTEVAEAAGSVVQDVVAELAVAPSRTSVVPVFSSLMETTTPAPTWLPLGGGIVPVAVLVFIVIVGAAARGRKRT